MYSLAGIAVDASYDTSSLKGAPKNNFPRPLTMVESLYPYLTQRATSVTKKKVPSMDDPMV